MEGTGRSEAPADFAGGERQAAVGPGIVAVEPAEAGNAGIVAGPYFTAPTGAPI